MTTATVLVRTVVRICGGDAAFVADDTRAIACSVGIDAAAARDVVRAIDAGRPPIPGRALLCRLALPPAQAERTSHLYVVSDRPRALDASTRAALDVLVAEIAVHLDEPRAVTGEAFVGHLARGIDSIGDPAAIFGRTQARDAAVIRHVNPAFEAVFGHAPATAIGRTIALLAGELTDDERLAFLDERVRATGEARGAVVLYRSDGVPVWVELSLRAVAASAQAAACVVATLRDVTTRKEFELAIAKEKRKLQVTLAAIGDAVITTVADGRVDFVNLAARTLFGIDAAEAYGHPLASSLRLTDAEGTTIDALRDGDDAGGTRRGQALFGRGERQKHVAFVTSPIADEGYVVVLRDVTAQHRLATQLSYEAAHDSLTGMYNRRKFDEVLLDAIEASQSDGTRHTLAFLDLDRFKHINDSCGHAVGDRVLFDLAHLLQAQLRGRDVLARIGGDEFAVLLHDCTRENARRVLDALRRSVDSYRLAYRGAEYRVGVSIGIAAIDGGERDAASILRSADAACYAAKQQGRNAIAG